MWNPFKKEEKAVEVASHSCDYNIVASHNEKLYTYSDSQHSHWETHLLYRCDCGEWYRSNIDGKWTKADIKKLEKKEEENNLKG